MARWSDIAQWVGPTVNEGDGDGRPGELEDRMSGHVGMVLHIAEGTYAGTISWERNPVSEVSSHFVVAKDGRIAQVVDTDIRSWCQGAGNSGWISVENEGHASDTPTPQQVEALAQLYARCMSDYRMPARITDSTAVGGLGWHGMGGAAWGGHYQCPGAGLKAARPAILARAQQINGGDDMQPDERAAVLTARAFADAAAAGAETYWSYPVDGKPKVAASMAPYWDKIAAEVAAKIPAAGGPAQLVAHTHEGGETGQAIPTT